MASFGVVFRAKSLIITRINFRMTSYKLALSLGFEGTDDTQAKRDFYAEWTDLIL